MMKPPKFTEQAQEVLAASHELVRQFRHSQWDVEHILLALLHQEGGVTAEILKEMGVEIEPVGERVQQSWNAAPGWAMKVPKSTSHHVSKNCIRMP
jgi:ATP-dependent Clp protease ATP-binding subunit ClpC